MAFATKRAAFVIVLLGGLLSAGNQAYAECQVPNHWLVRFGITAVSVTLDRNDICRWKLGIISTVKKFKVVVRPRHGIVGKAEQSENYLEVAYKPRKNFIGQDRFEANLDYEYQNTPHETRLVYYMNIR